MDHIELKFEFSAELEIKRVEDTRARIDWFNDNGYTVNLPADPKNIEASVKKEFDRSIFEKIRNQIIEEWKQYASEFPAKIASLNLSYQSIYIIQLTRYGSGGSYDLPDSIILNVRNEEIKDILQTIIHEIIHLAIEKSSLNHKVSYWKKERLVDLTMDKLYPEISKMQKLGEDTVAVDTSFNKYFPKIETVIKNI